MAKTTHGFGVPMQRAGEQNVEFQGSGIAVREIGAEATAMAFGEYHGRIVPRIGYVAFGSPGLQESKVVSVAGPELYLG